MPPFWRRLLGRWSERPAPSGPAPAAYDVLLALTPSILPPGVRSVDAIQAVRAAVEAIEGVGWTSVEFHLASPAPSWLEVLPTAGATLPDEADLTTMRERIETAMREALAVLAQSCGSPGETWPDQESEWGMPKDGKQPPGFSEGVGFRPLPAALNYGAVREDDAVMLTRLLGLVLPADAVPSLAARAIERFGSFASVLAAPQAELRTVRGLGTHSIAAIKLAHTAAVRLAKARAAEGPVLDNWDQLMAYLTAVLARERIEQFRILFLDGDSRLLADEGQAKGTVNHTPVYPREVVRRALELGAASLILVHNHPSGDPSPSRADLEMTAQIHAAASVVSVTVSDHVIVGNGRWLSFRQEGFL